MIGGSIPNGDAFSKGYDYAKKAIDTVNETEKNGFIGGVWSYISSSGKEYIEGKYTSFLKSKIGLGDLTSDTIKDYTSDAISSIKDYLANMINHKTSVSDKTKIVSDMTANSDPDNINNKFLSITPSQDTDNIDKPTVGVVLAANNEDKQITIVEYPSDRLLVNIDEEKYNIVDIVFTNKKDESMLKKNYEVAAYPIKFIDDFDYLDKIFSEPDQNDDNTPTGSDIYSGTYTGLGAASCSTSGTVSFKFSNNLLYITTSNVNGGGSSTVALTNNGRIFNSQDSKGTIWAGGLGDSGLVEGVFSVVSTGCAGEYHISK